jgi:asparagine synthase (glutamine-hydrolysing)
LLAAGQVTVTPYWALVPRDSGPADPALVRRDLETTLERAVASQLVADVPLGAFLSGGVDSSAVVAAATRARREPVMTFSVSFLDAAFDEGPYARRVAEHLGTEHYEFRLSPKVGALVEAVAWHFDEPFADSSALPTLLVSLAARQKVTVALSGDGGDELFGGYDRYALELGRARWDVVPAGLRRALLGGVARRLPYGAYGRNYLDNLSRSGLQRYLHSISLFSEVDRSRYFEPLGSAPDALAAARWFDDDTSAMPLLTKMSLADWHTYLPGDILVKVDRASMAASLETRAPFLAPEVAELAMRIPASMKLRGFEGKAILRDTVRPWLPAGVLDRPKRGFGVPLVRWFREELREAVYETLTRRNGILADLVDREYVDILWNEHQSRRRDHSTRLWAMFVLSRWHQHLQSGAWRSRETAPRIDAQSILAELEVGGAACGRT